MTSDQTETSCEKPSAPIGLPPTSVCAILPRPYYQDGHVTIYHADCRLIMPAMTAETFDLMLTDPPYGIGADQTQEKRGGKQSGKALYPSRSYGSENWDSAVVEEWVMFLARRLCRKQIIFGGNYYDLPPAKCWLVWDKVNGENTYADCELAWTNLEKAVRRKVHQWHGMIRKGQEVRFHPTQKPLEVMSWALAQAGDDVATVLDPWMGSGTTLRACKDAGKRAIGIDREERYCEIAAKRMHQEVLAL